MNNNLIISFENGCVIFNFSGDSEAKFHFSIHNNESLTFVVRIDESGKKKITIDEEYFENCGIICIYSSDIPWRYLKIDVENQRYEFNKRIE